MSWNERPAGDDKPVGWDEVPAPRAPMNQAEALRVAYEIIDAQARLLESFRTGRWSDRADRIFVTENLPRLDAYHRDNA